MQFQEDPIASQAISSYDDHHIRVNKTDYPHTIALTLHSTTPLPQIKQHSQIDLTIIEQLLRDGPELILFGTGRDNHDISHDCLLPLIQAQIGFEVMPTAAACRTFNLLASDERKVAALLIIEQNKNFD